MVTHGGVFPAWYTQDFKTQKGHARVSPKGEILLIGKLVYDTLKTNFTGLVLPVL
jgi:hypothetical protein